MKKLYIFLLIVFICSVLAGCAVKVEESKIMKRLENGITGYEVLVDKDTGVMYFYGTRCVTPLYNADGSLRIWEGLQ